MDVSSKLPRPALHDPFQVRSPQFPGDYTEPAGGIDELLAQPTTVPVPP
jgi:hypothetical protein